MSAFEVTWADLLCVDCTQDILAHGWGPQHQPLLRGEATCTACAMNISRLVRRADGAGFDVRHWSLTVPEGAQQWRVAEHEAAHAVLSERNGLTVTKAQIEPAPVNLGGTERELTGHVLFDFPEGGAPLPNVANAIHAGWAIDRLWLKDKGLDGDVAAQIDVAKTAAADMVAIDFGTDPAVHVQAMRDADAQVLEYRGEIAAVKDELLRNRRMGGDAVRQAMQRVREADKARAIAKRTTPQPNPATDDGPASTAQLPAVAGGTSTTSTGGTAMSLIDQARTTLTGVNERSNYILGALRQAQLDIETNETEIAGVSSEAQTPTEIAGVYRMALEQIERVMGLVEHAVTATEVYATSLHS